MADRRCRYPDRFLRPTSTTAAKASRTTTRRRATAATRTARPTSTSLQAAKAATRSAGSRRGRGGTQTARAGAGSYTATIRIASPNGGGSLHIGFNGPSNVWKTVSIPKTGGWQAWTDVVVPVTLGAGVQQMTLLFDT